VKDLQVSITYYILATRYDDEIIGPNVTVPRISGIPGPFLLFFYSFDCAEPMHVHVRRERSQAKFWIEPAALCWNRGFSSRELNEIRRIIVEYQPRIIEAWHAHCGTDGNDDSAS
jgi:hypothetical protein